MTRKRIAIQQYLVNHTDEKLYVLMKTSNGSSFPTWRKGAILPGEKMDVYIKTECYPDRPRFIFSTYVSLFTVDPYSTDSTQRIDYQNPYVQGFLRITCNPPE